MDNDQIKGAIAGQINSNFDFRKLLAGILSGWYWFVLALAVACTGAYLYLRYTTPVYSVQSTLLVDDKSDIAKNVLSKIEGGGQSETNLYNEIFQLRSQDLIAKTVDSLDLNVHYYVKGRVKENEIYEESPFRFIFDSSGYKGGEMDLQIKQISEGTFEVEQGKDKRRVSFDTWTKAPFGRYKVLYGGGLYVNNGYLASGLRVHMEPVNVTVGNILRRFKVNVTDGRTSMLDLNYEDNLPYRGVAFQNALIVFYRRAALYNATLSAERTRNFINERLLELVGKLQNTDERVADIRRSSGVYDEGQGSAIMAAKTEAERKIDDLMLQRRAVGNLKQAVLSGNGAVAGLSVSDPTLAALISQYNTALLNAEKYKDDVPALSLEKANAEAALASVRKRIADAADKVSATLEYSLQNAYSSNAQYSSQLSAGPAIDRSIKDVSRNYETQQNMYLILYQRRLENEISANSMTDRSKIIVAPHASGDPIRPVPQSIYIMAALLGLAIPLSFFSIKEFFNNKLGNESDITSLTTIPILGSISRNTSANDIVVGELIRTGIAEQFRLIRANLDFFSTAEQKKVIMVTSSISGEGKSFISINLGLTIAIASKRVVIMEFDLRKPKVSERLNLSREGGISGYLAGLVGLDKVIKPSGIHPNLYVANCGPIPPNPAELLLLPKTRQLIEDLQEMFDVVVIDTAPIGMVSDAFTLAQYSGVNLIITRQGHTVKGHVKMLEMTYQENKLKNAGIIFNGVQHEKRYGYGYGYGNGYGYGYGYGYGNGGGYYDEDEAKKTKPGVLSMFKKK